MCLFTSTICLSLQINYHQEVLIREPTAACKTPQLMSPCLHSTCGVGEEIGTLQSAWFNLHESICNFYILSGIWVGYFLPLISLARVIVYEFPFLYLISFFQYALLNPGIRQLKAKTFRSSFLWLQNLSQRTLSEAVKHFSTA